MTSAGILAGTFAGAFVVGLSGAMVPGPMFAATVMHARERGWLAGVLVSSGHGLLELAVLVAIVLGAGGALRHPVVARTVAVAGGAFLVWMGVLAAVRPPGAAAGGRETESADPPAGAKVRRPLGPFLAGIWTSVSQPYGSLWWAAVGASFVIAASRAGGYPGVAAFYVGHVLADVAWFTLVAAAVGAGGRLLSERGHRRLSQACGVMLAGFGCAFVLVGLAFPGLLAQAAAAGDA